MKKVFKLALIIFLIFLFLFIIIWGVLSYIDAKQDNKSYRAWIIHFLGLSHVSFLKDLTSPKIKTLPKWEPTSLYWYPIDQKTLKPDKGYRCALIGKLITDPQIMPLFRGWKVETKDKQILRLTSLNNSLFYILQSKYNDMKETWESNSIFTRYYSFNLGDIVLVEWNCPVKDPQQMLNEKNQIKEEYLKIKPFAVSKSK